MRSIRKMHDRIAAQAPAIEQRIQAIDAEVTRALHEDDDQSPLNRLMAYRATLWAQNGWFPSSWETPLSLISHTAHLLGTPDHDVAEEAISDHFDGCRDKLINTIVKNHPERESIVRDAIAAHDEGRYALSIPVMLIQADGIGAAYFEMDSIYSISKKNFDRIKAKFDEQSDAIRVKYLSYLIGCLTPLNASRSRRDRYNSPFNRHTIIHGECTDYPSAINSLKSISWLNFVGEIVSPL